jgi:hypothetical protein
MLPNINGVPIRIYSIPTTATQHEWRNKYADREKSYQLLKLTKGQPYLFNSEDLRIREGLGYLKSEGYIVMAAHSLRQAGISPAPDGKSWINYRFQLKIEGAWQTQYLRVVEARPRSPHKGDFRLWYIYIENDIIENNLSNTEESKEEVPSDTDSMIVERVIEHNAISSY